MTIFEYDEEEHMRLEREEQYRKGEEAGEKGHARRGRSHRSAAEQHEKTQTHVKNVPAGVYPTGTCFAYLR